MSVGPEKSQESTGRKLEPSVDRPLPTLAVAGVVALVVTAAAMVAYSRFGAPGVVLVLAGGALLGSVAAFWSSLRTLIGETKLTGADAFAIGTSGGAEEQKRAVLRALKDLEFERAVGKISEEDYKVLVGRYRAEAKRLLKQIDEASAAQRARAEAVVQAELERLGIVPASNAAPAANAERSDPAADSSTSADDPATATPDEASADAKASESEGEGTKASADLDPGEEQAAESANKDAGSVPEKMPAEPEPERAREGEPHA